jgi:hypothetical protein
MEYGKKFPRPKDYCKDTCMIFFIFFFFDLWWLLELITSGSSLIPQVLGNKFQSKLLEAIDPRLGFFLTFTTYHSIFAV